MASYHISRIAPPIVLLQPNSSFLDLKFANRKMTKTPRTKTDWKILKATGTVQDKPIYARPTEKNLVQTKKNWDL